MPDFGTSSRNLTPAWRMESAKLIAKGLLPGSNKLSEVLWRVMRRKYGV